MSTTSLGIQVEVTLDLTYLGYCSSVDMVSVCGQEGSRAVGVIIQKRGHECIVIGFTAYQRKEKSEPRCCLKEFPFSGQIDIKAIICGGV